VALIVELAVTVLPRLLAIPFGADLHLYLGATSRFLDGGSFYLPHELAGPFVVQVGDILYPPVTMLLFAPFLVLPEFLWWAIPLGVTGWCVWSLRPSVLGWAGIVACLVLPYTVPLILAGNPGMWTTAAVALGLRYGWPAALVLVKPTLLPFALIGANRRSWWIAVAGLGLLSLPFLPATIDYLAVLRNAQSPDGLLYSFGNVPMMLIPVVAWLGRR